MMIGDVTGKGVGAAAVTSLVRHTAKAASEFDARPAQILARVDAALRRSPTVSLCTALCLRVTREGATLAVAGHPLPLRVRDGSVEEVGRHGTLLGAPTSKSWAESEIAIEPGETLVAFTDGVTDAVGIDGERWGTERLSQALAGATDAQPQALRRRLVDALDEFQVGAQADDTAIVIMRPAPTRPSGAGRQLSGVGARVNG
jgi:serine phosphatase RsbU (regulator of sigma subunit)